MDNYLGETISYQDRYYLIVNTVELEGKNYFLLASTDGVFDLTIVEITDLNNLNSLVEITDSNLKKQLLEQIGK